MCGISGYFGNKNNRPSDQSILKTLEQMKNRGNDGVGSYSHNFNNKKFLNLNHTRLSIIDPTETANQPLMDDKGIIVFNGMIYNYLEVKKKLEKNNEFKTKSDTEVLLKFLNIYGPKNLSLLDGMWSFAYYNFKNQKLILSRDRFGEKPLFFFKNNKSFLFGSCLNYIKSLSHENFKINFKKIENYLKFGFRTLNIENESLLKKIYSVEPGSFISLDSSLNFQKNFYWKTKLNGHNKKINFNNEKNKLKSLFTNVIKTRLRSDFPSACLLSGGIDSSSIVSIANQKLKKKIDCFSLLSKDKNYDESYYINKTIKKEKIKHEYVPTTKENKKNFLHLRELIKSTSSLVPTTTWFAFSKLCEKIKLKKYKVILTGTGGDEMFAGYYIHQLHYLFSIKYSKNFNKKYEEWQKKLAPLLRNNFLKNYELYEKKIKKKNDLMFYDFLTLKKYFMKYKLIKNNGYKANSYYFKKSLLNDLFNYSLPSQIAAIDNISMFHGLESRAPFLSKDLYEKSFSYPNDYLINDGFGKYILRKSLKKVVDDEILDNRDKVGFFININNLFNFRDRKILKLLYSNKYINSLIDKRKLKLLLLKENKTNQECHFIFSIMNIIIFIDEYE